MNEAILSIEREDGTRIASTLIEARYDARLIAVSAETVSREGKLCQVSILQPGYTEYTSEAAGHYVPAQSITFRARSEDLMRLSEMLAAIANEANPAPARR